MLGPQIDPFGFHLDPSWASLGPNGCNLTINGAQLGPDWIRMGPNGSQLDPSWAHNGPKWISFGPNLAPLRSILAQVGPRLDPKWSQLVPNGIHLGIFSAHNEYPFGPKSSWYLDHYASRDVCLMPMTAFVSGGEEATIPQKPICL